MIQVLLGKPDLGRGGEGAVAVGRPAHVQVLAFLLAAFEGAVVGLGELVVLRREEIGFGLSVGGKGGAPGQGLVADFLAG